MAEKRYNLLVRDVTSQQAMLDANGQNLNLSHEFKVFTILIKSCIRLEIMKYFAQPAQDPEINRSLLALKRPILTLLENFSRRIGDTVDY